MMSCRLQDKNLLFVNVCLNVLISVSVNSAVALWHTLALISECIHLNLGFSLVTTPTSSSLALKSMFRTEDRHDIASWKEKDGECEE